MNLEKPDDRKKRVSSASMDATPLRKRAEKILKANQTPTILKEQKLLNPQELIHELQVHQVELELQNEELRRTQSELELTLTQYFELYDLAPVGYLSVAESGLIVAVNLTAATLLGVFRQELLNQPFSKFIHREDQDRYYLYRKEVLSTAENREAELRLIRTDGSCFQAQIVGSSAETSEGSPLCRLIIHDIQSRKDAEVEKEKLEIRLREAEKLEALGRLAGGVAHDFNNMLSVIIGSAEMIRGELKDNDPLCIDLQSIMEAAERSVATTRQLMGFARQQTMTTRVLDLNQTISGMKFLLQRILGDNIRLDWQPTDSLNSVRMDPVQIDQILSNLCSNARKALPEGGVVSIQLVNCDMGTVTAAGKSTIPAGEYVELTFFDNGCGMNEHVARHAFDPFFTTARTGEGTGLGLAMVHGIITQNKGHVQLESKPGLGTTLRIYLPRCLEQVSIDPQCEPGIATEPHGETILLAEDEPAVMNLTRRILEKQGYRIVSATTSAEVIQMARQHQGDIHLVFTDCVMPKMNGRELVAELQTFLPGLKTLFMSGYPADVIAKEGLLDEDVAFIHKPYKQSELIRKIREVLDA